MNWYAVHTKPRQESLAQTSLEREGIETFFPKLKRKRTIRRVRRWVTGALFPNYLFARFDSERSGRLVKYANGVINIVSFGGRPARVEDAILDEIRRRAEADVVTLTPATFQPGDRVEIQEGPLRGLQGIFRQELRGSQRVAIMLEMLQSSAVVQVNPDSLARVD
jgi:transcriptional antiterminator RfaH